MKTYMGNAYASKSHTHTASQITDFASQVDSRINSKMGSYASIKYGSQTKNVGAGSFAGNPGTVNGTITLDSIAINQFNFVKMSGTISFTLSIVFDQWDITTNVTVKLPSGGTYYIEGKGYLSGGSTIETLSGKASGATGTNKTWKWSYSANYNIVRVA